MSAKKFEHFLVSRCEYMRCFIAGGVTQGSEPHVALSKKVLGMASKQLHVMPSVDCETASRLVDIATSSMLIPADKHELMVRLNDKVDLAAGVVASSARSARLAVEAASPKPSCGTNAQVQMPIHNSFVVP